MSDIEPADVSITEMMERIENYILGRLSQKEIDALWVEILHAPGWLRYLETEIDLRALAFKMKQE